MKSDGGNAERRRHKARNLNFTKHIFRHFTHNINNINEISRDGHKQTITGKHAMSDEYPIARNKEQSDERSVAVSKIRFTLNAAILKIVRQAGDNNGMEDRNREIARIEMGSDWDPREVG